MINYFIIQLTMHDCESMENENICNFLYLYAQPTVVDLTKELKDSSDNISQGKTIFRSVKV